MNIAPDGKANAREYKTPTCCIRNTPACISKCRFNWQIMKSSRAYGSSYYLLSSLKDFNCIGADFRITVLLHMLSVALLKYVFLFTKLLVKIGDWNVFDRSTNCTLKSNFTTVLRLWSSHAVWCSTIISMLCINPFSLFLKSSHSQLTYQWRHKILKSSVCPL